MSPRHAVGILRPVLITVAILAIAYLIGGPGLFTPSGLTGLAIVTMVVGVAILFGLRAIQADEHRHLTQFERRTTPRWGASKAIRPQPWLAGMAEEPQAKNEDSEGPRRVEPFHVMGGIPLLGTVSTRTADNALRFSRRVFLRRHKRIS